jgi:hypothetical protein
MMLMYFVYRMQEFMFSNFFSEIVLRTFYIVNFGAFSAIPV